MEAAIVVLCTCPDRAVATSLARAAVEQRLAACVNLVPGVTSVYRWEDETRLDEEVLLVAKTTAGAFRALESCWRGLHPYELPEVIAVPIETGSDAYLAWIKQSVSR